MELFLILVKAKTHSGKVNSIYLVLIIVFSAVIFQSDFLSSFFDFSLPKFQSWFFASFYCNGCDGGTVSYS